MLFRRVLKDYGRYECYAENYEGAMIEPCVTELHLPGRRFYRADYNQVSKYYYVGVAFPSVL